jgi:phosphatidate phosphatase APP1
VTERKSSFGNILSDLAAAGGAARDFVRARMPRDPHSVVLYRGFGINGRVLLFGRALEDEGIAAADASHSPWKNAVAMLRRADADPVARAIVRVTIGTARQDFATDDEGFFSGWMATDGAERVDDDWIRTRAELLSPAADRESIQGEGRALLPGQPPALLVISDVDDTVLQSNVTSFLLAVRTMVFENARTRLPFPGVAAFYQALHRGVSGDARNPLFYVSSSPWNLFDVITEFLELQRIPTGPLLLRDVDLGLGMLSHRHHHVHKREMIRQIMETYAGVPAILIGDSGQQDPEIYRDVVHQHAGRVKAVYIRDVTRNDERSRAIAALANEVLAAGSSLVLAADTLAAARHAAENGFISPDALGDIGEEKRADEGETKTKKPSPGDLHPDDEHKPPVVIE